MQKQEWVKIIGIFCNLPQCVYVCYMYIWKNGLYVQLYILHFSYPDKLQILVASWIEYTEEIKIISYLRNFSVRM